MICIYKKTTLNLKGGLKFIEIKSFNLLKNLILNLNSQSNSFCSTESDFYNMIKTKKALITYSSINL